MRLQAKLLTHLLQQRGDVLGMKGAATGKFHLLHKRVLQQTERYNDNHQRMQAYISSRGLKGQSMDNDTGIIAPVLQSVHVDRQNAAHYHPGDIMKGQWH
jgi:hypothetical protein